MQYDPDALVSEDQGRLRPGESAPDDVDLTLHRAVAIRQRPRWQAQPPARLLQAQQRSLGSPRSAAEPVARGGGSLPAVTVGWWTGRGRIAGRTAGRFAAPLRPHSRCLGLDRFRPRFGRFPAVPASLVRTSDERAVALRVLLQQVRLPALRAGARDGPIPGGELAVRVVHAAEEALAEA